MWFELVIVAMPRLVVLFSRDAAGEPLRRRVEQEHRAPPIAIPARVIQRDPGLAANLRGRGAAALAAQSSHLEKVGEVAGEGQRKPDVERAVVVVLHAQALISGAAPEKKRAHDVQHVLRQHELLIDIDAVSYTHLTLPTN